MMTSDQGKLFIGGISWETTEKKLKDYFSAFGDVMEAVIMKDRATGRARGFGFVVFADPMVADMVVLEKHNIDGRMVEAKKAVPREEQINRSSSCMPLNLGRTKKIFVGGLASTVTESEFRKYFEQFGNITDIVVMYDHGTQRPRGFGFITYDSEDAVDRVLIKTFHELKDKMVEVKRAVPKDSYTGPCKNNGFTLTTGSNRGSPYTGNYITNPITSYNILMDPRYSCVPGSRFAYPPYAEERGYGGAGYAYGSSVSSSPNSGGGWKSSVSDSSSYGSFGSNDISTCSYASTPGKSIWTSNGSTLDVSRPWDSHQLHSSYSLGGSLWGLGGNGSRSGSPSSFGDIHGTLEYGRFTWQNFPETSRSSVSGSAAQGYRAYGVSNSFHDNVDIFSSIDEGYGGPRSRGVPV